MFTTICVLSVIGALCWFCSCFDDPGSTSQTERRPRIPPAGLPPKGRTSNPTRPAPHRYKIKISVAAPTERDNNLRSFSVVNSEGEVHSINTADRNSPFYGPVWTRILGVYTSGEFIRGRAIMRRMSSQEDRFSGYSISIDGIEAFLPVSKAARFYNPEHDATRKCLALKIDTIYPNGMRSGNIIVDAYAPLKYVIQKFKKAELRPGAIPYALAMDYDSEHLIFPFHQEKELLVPLNDAITTAQRQGLPSNPDMLTGYYWQLQILSKGKEQQLAAPLSVLL